MNSAPLVLAATQLVAILLSAAVAVLALRTTFQWHHDQRRAQLSVLGTVALLANAVVLGLDFTAGPPLGWQALARLVPQLTLPTLVIVLLRTLRHRDAVARDAARDAPFAPTTGLPNHPLLLRQIIPALARCRREGSPAVMLVAGVDGLAHILDRRGPGQAAEMLRSLATILGDATRAGDLSGHVEPDVLGTLLPAATGESAERVATRLRALASERMVDPEMSGRRVAVSVGIAVVGDGAEPAALEEAISAALTAYRQALAEGGDRVRLAAPPPARSPGGAP